MTSKVKVVIHHIIFLFFLIFFIELVCAQEKKSDVIVYGGTAGGVMSALSAAKEGATVTLIEPGNHVGGMLTGGLSHTDFGDRAVIGGMSLEFYQRVADYYHKDLYFWRGPEPHVGEKILKDWLKELNVNVVYGKRLKNVKKNNRTIESVEMLNGEIYNANIFIDGTYEGDLMAQAGVSYTIGREGISQYGESWAGRQPLVSTRHNFEKPVSPFKNEKSGELLPLVNPIPLVPVGESDGGVQDYGFRLTMTDDPHNIVPITKPDDYDPSRYELLRRYMLALKPTTLSEAGIFVPRINLPNNKTDINSSGPVSFNLGDGTGWAYPDADYPLRDSIWSYYISYTRGLLYFAISDSSLPKNVREEASKWGLCKDEFVDTDHIPHQLYVREARRMIGEYVLTQHDLIDNVVKYDGIGMGSYNMDIRHNQTTFRWVSRFPELVAEAINEGYISIPVKPYEIPYRSLLPKYEECSNLIVPICISSSNLAFASFRMEPQYMIAGHAAGVAAAMASREKIELHKISITNLQAKLVEQGQIISFDSNPNGFFQRGNVVIVDDDMRRFVEKKGSWQSSEDPTTRRHDITFLLSDLNDNAEIIYRPYLPTTGKYKVYGWWPKLKDGASSVTLEIKASNNVENVIVDQRKTGDAWEYIGTFNFERGSDSEIKFSNIGVKGRVIADAFKFELLD